MTIRLVAPRLRFVCAPLSCRCRCLCVSDVNKKLLVQCPDLLTLVTEMLLLDPEHARQDQDEAIKAAIQKDACESVVAVLV